MICVWLVGYRFNEDDDWYLCEPDRRLSIAGSSGSGS
jgi:hypothetical protein